MSTGWNLNSSRTVGNKLFLLDDTPGHIYIDSSMYEDVDRTPLKEMAEALAKETDPGLIRSFLESLLTENEVNDISSRWTLVRLIDRGMSQRTISRKLGLSLCKITRGSRELKKEDSPFARMIQLFQDIQK